MRSTKRHFRFVFFLAGLLALAGTSLAGTRTSLRMSESNALNPFGFFNVAPSSQTHESATIHFAQLPVCDAPADGGFHHAREAIGVVNFSGVESENLLIDVALQVERRDLHIRSLDRAFEQRPEVFESVGVDLSTHVFVRVIDGLMHEMPGHAVVRRGSVGKQFRSALNMVIDDRVQFGLLGGWDDLRPDLAATLKQAMNDSLTDCAASPDFLFALMRVHIPRLSADESLVTLNGASQLAETPRFHGLANAMEHKPSSALGDAESAAQLVTADTVFAVGYRPDGGKPLIQPERAILENRADLVRKLFPAILATQHRAGPDLSDAHRSAVMAADLTIGPLDRPHVGVADGFVRKVADSADEVGGESGHGLTDFEFERVKQMLELVTADRRAARQVIADVGPTDFAIEHLGDLVGVELKLLHFGDALILDRIGPFAHFGGGVLRPFVRDGLDRSIDDQYIDACVAIAGQQARGLATWMDRRADCHKAIRDTLALGQIGFYVHKAHGPALTGPWPREESRPNYGECFNPRPLPGDDQQMLKTSMVDGVNVAVGQHEGAMIVSRVVKLQRASVGLLDLPRIGDGNGDRAIGPFGWLVVFHTDNWGDLSTTDTTETAYKKCDLLGHVYLLSATGRIGSTNLIDEISISGIPDSASVIPRKIGLFSICRKSLYHQRIG